MCNKIPTIGSKPRKPTDEYTRLQYWNRLKEIICSLVKMKALVYCWVCARGKHLHDCIILIRGLVSYN